MNEPSLDQEVVFIKNWAQDNKCYFEDKGECGFGRACVGILHRATYPYYGDDTGGDPEAGPPVGVKDAYHKSECLAVLGRGPDAIHQLYLWIRHLADNGFVVREEPRQNQSYVEAMLHGFTNPILVKRTQEVA